MGKPAARAIMDKQVCPLSDGPKPHVGGIIIGPGVESVLIGGMPAAVVGDQTQCMGPVGKIILGSMGVFIGGKPAARMGDPTLHGGFIASGLPSVLIGDFGSAIVDVKQLANTLFEQMHESADVKQVVATSRVLALIEASLARDAFAHKHNEEDSKVQFSLLNDRNEPMSNVSYIVNTSDGKEFRGTTGSDGKTQTIAGYTEAMCRVAFLN